jgi:hypothetical protein
METIFWGPDGWEFLHILSFIFPENPTFDDKNKFATFMKTVCYILPCKYCRASFTKYSESLPISDYLTSRITVIDWLYKMHNKVNKKLRSQGFCKHANPELDTIYKKYEPHVANIHKIINKTTQKHTENHKENTSKCISKCISECIKEVCNYICMSGINFLGSIVFNYQSYFSNCHTTEEKTKIVSVYHSFFNQIIPLISSCVKLNIKPPKIPIRAILLRNEPYSKLIKWFYNQDYLLNIKTKWKNEHDYINYFNKHIVSSCNNPKSDNIKSCRKTVSRRKTLRKTTSTKT